MLVNTYTPCAQLQSLVKCYYVSESTYTDFVTDVFFADGCVEVVFHVGLDFYRGTEKESSAKIIGQILDPLTMKARGQGKSFGIWFYPHAFSLFCGLPLHEFNNRAVALDALFAPSFIHSIQNYIHDNDLANLISLTDAYLTSQLNRRNHSSKEKLLTHAVAYIQAKKGAADLDCLVNQCNISYRYLQQIFVEYVGISPKLLIRIMRFQYALQQLTRKQSGLSSAGPYPSGSNAADAYVSGKLTELTYLAGYYDQAHFIREFKAFTGMTPSQFQSSQHPINQYFIHL